MTWVKIDDQMADHPKFTSLDRFAPLALALQVRAFCYASRHLTDGFLPIGVIPSLIDGFESWGIETGGVPEMFAVCSNGDEFNWPAIMVDAGFWEKKENGYLIHDYLDYNPSKAEVLAQRKAAKKRMSNNRTSSKEVLEKFARSSQEVPLPRSPSPSPVLQESKKNRKENTLSAELDAKPLAPAVEEWPPDDLWLKEFLTTQTWLPSPHTALYEHAWWDAVSEAVNGLEESLLRREFARMEAWCAENPQRKPTARGLRRFIRGWLERQYERERRTHA